MVGLADELAARTVRTGEQELALRMTVTIGAVTGRSAALARDGDEQLRCSFSRRITDATRADVGEASARRAGVAVGRGEVGGIEESAATTEHAARGSSGVGAVTAWVGIRSIPVEHPLPHPSGQVALPPATVA